MNLSVIFSRSGLAQDVMGCKRVVGDTLVTTTMKRQKGGQKKKDRLWGDVWRCLVTLGPNLGDAFGGACPRSHNWIQMSRGATKNGRFMVMPDNE